MADGTSPMNFGFIDVWCGKNTAVQGGNLVLNVTQECGPDIASTLMMNSGKFEVDLVTAYGPGIVTAVTLLSQGTNNKDEMDLEFVGNNMSYVQTMYFVNGLRVPGNDASVDIYVTSDTSKTSHKYGMEFTSTSLTWFIDGRAVRTVKKVNGTMFPSKPMGLHLGIWDASQYSSWAGVANWTLAPPGGSFQAKISSLQITPYNCSTPLSPTSSVLPVPTTPLQSSGAANPSATAPTQSTSSSSTSTTPSTPSTTPSTPSTTPSTPSTTPSTPNTTGIPSGNSASGGQIWQTPYAIAVAILVTLANSI